MDPVEESNDIPHYQHLHFQSSEDPVDAARQCLVQTYSTLLNNEEALNLLKVDLNKYAKLVDNNDTLHDVAVTNTSAEWKSGLDNIDINTLLKPLCIQTINCEKENINENNFQEFLKQFNEASVNKPNFSYEPSVNKSDIGYEPRVRKIAKSFAPQSCFSNKKVNKIPVMDKSVLPAELEKIQPDISKELEEVKSANFGFKTAREELTVQNVKKFGCRSMSQSNHGGQLTTGLKRKLGTRRNVQNKFVSPMLSNNSSEEMLPKSYEWPVDEILDERLKNIEPRMVELIRNEIMDVGAVVDWDDIAGLEFAKTAIQEAVVWPLLRPDIFTGLRKPPKGILLFGPPGTGKTLIGKCVASQSKSTFFSISASSLTSKWIGEGEKMVRALFAVARCHQPAVIFIDEVDSLLSQRSDTEHESSRRLKTEFLIQLDGATTDNDERILLIGATNRPQELDEAARRRFVKRLYIPLPEIQARLQLVTRLMAQERHDLSDENIKEISRLSDGYSGADMKNLCSEASLGPIRCIDLSKMQSIQATEVRPVSMDDFIKAFSRVKSSVSPNDLKHYLVWNKTYGSGSSF